MGIVQRASDALERALDLAAANPLAVAAGVAVLLLVLVAAYLLLRRSTAERLHGVLAKREAVTVLMHPNPDPDAMACALGVAAIARSAGTAAELAYPGQIRHQENRAFRTVLDLELDRVETVDDLEGDVVLVDHNESRGVDGGSVDPVAVVDHHPGDGTGSAFTDVRPDYGACATIVAEYFDELEAARVEETDLLGGDDDDDANGYEPEPEGEVGDDERDDEDLSRGDLELSPPLATGLLYGVLSDTNRLTRGCSGAEFAAASYLYQSVDEETLDRIANPEVDAEVLDVKARAITEREVRGPYAVCDVGAVSNADAIPQAADELVQLEAVSAVVVLGDYDDAITLSGRSRDDRVHMGDAIAAAVDDVPLAKGGGHARMGGGQVPTEDGEIEAVRDVDRDSLIEGLFAAMSGER